MKFNPILGLCIVLTCVKAGAQSSTESREIPIRPPNAAVDLQIVKAREVLILERKCQTDNPAPYRDNFPSLEFGFRIAVPQEIPMETQWYSRYSCANPGARP